MSESQRLPVRIFLKSDRIIPIWLNADRRIGPDDLSEKVLWKFPLRGWFRKGFIVLLGSQIDFIETRGDE